MTVTGECVWLQKSRWSYLICGFLRSHMCALCCRLKIFSEESVPLFGPPLPSPPVFTDHQEFRDFLLVKCMKVFKKSSSDMLTYLRPLCLPYTDLPSSPSVINGEKATLETPTFAQKRQRTLDMLIRSLYQDLMPDLHKVQQRFHPRFCCRELLLYFFCHLSTLLLLTPPCHFSRLQRLESLLICPLLYSTAASAYCTTLHWILLQCWLSQQGSLSSHHFSSYICCFFPSFHCCS